MENQGLMVKLTDARARRLRSRLESQAKRHTRNTWDRFDYGAEEAVIYADKKLIPLAEYITGNR